MFLQLYLHWLMFSCPGPQTTRVVSSDSVVEKEMSKLLGKSSGTNLTSADTVLIGEDDSMVNKIVLWNEIVHLGPPV